MKPYPDYKQTGLAWLPAVPSGWRVLHIRELFTERREKVSDKMFAPLSVSRQGVVPQLENVALSEDGENRKRVKVGDFVINSRSDRKASSGVSEYDGSVSLINIVLKPRSELHGGYTHYLLKCHDFVEEYYRNGRGIVADLWTTRYDEMKAISLPVPPPAEQRAIVAYLDEKTAKIDRLIALKEREVALLNEKKQAMISRVVTRGLDPNAELVDSGVDWIGKVPKGWRMLKVRSACDERSEKVSDREFPPLSVGKMGVVAQLETAVKTDDGDNRKLVKMGDFAINSRSDRKGSCGLSNLTGSVSLVNIVLKIREELDGRYAHHLFRTVEFGEEFYRNGHGIVSDLWTTRFSEMKNIGISVPPLSEQRAIVAYLDKATAKIDKAVAAIEKSIALLKERKTRLVSDVVTGRVEIMRNEECGNV